MKGSPRSIMLAWANRVAGWWRSTATGAVSKQQQSAPAKKTAPHSATAKVRSKRRRRR